MKYLVNERAIKWLISGQLFAIVLISLTNLNLDFKFVIKEGKSMILRQITPKLKDLARQFPAVAILGPRQSGKTTLAQITFPDYLYFSFEDFDTRDLVKQDPRAFLMRYKDEPGVILDEVQNFPELFSYMQGHIDTYKKKGHFIVTGSQNFALNESISQSLAGRIAILTLLPLSIQELQTSQLLPQSIDEAIFKGMYPSLFADDASPQDWYRSYINTYVERDVRQIKNISDLSAFQTFMKLCAGRVGQVLSLTSLSNDCGMSVPTVKQWLSVLEASYILFMLQPFYRNMGKRVIKSPKLYFYDTGLVCNLLQITSQEQLFTHYLRGSLFESYMISDFIKQRFNQGLNSNVYFWRDQSDYEVDCIIEEHNQIVPLEIKATQTFNPHFFDHLTKWNDITDSDKKNNIIVYGGSLTQDTQNGKLLSWHEAGMLYKKYL